MQLRDIFKKINIAVQINFFLSKEYKNKELKKFFYICQNSLYKINFNHTEPDHIFVWVRPNFYYLYQINIIAFILEQVNTFFFYTGLSSDICAQILYIYKYIFNQPSHNKTIWAWNFWSSKLLILSQCYFYALQLHDKL